MTFFIYAIAVMLVITLWELFWLAIEPDVWAGTWAERLFTKVKVAEPSPNQDGPVVQDSEDERVIAYESEGIPWDSVEPGYDYTDDCVREKIRRGKAALGVEDPK